MNISHLFSDWLWLRPMWLLALLPLPLLLWWLARLPSGAGRWQDIIDRHLLRVLLQQGKDGVRSRWPLLLIGIGWILAVLALAGPSFRQQDAPLYQRDSARVYLLDLSPSMNADDVKPSRLARARLKLLDALAVPRDGEQALMVYAGSAHVLTPLASDARTLAAQVPVLSTALPPVSGNRPELALQRAVQLLRDAGHSSGEIVWLTDGIDADQIDRVSTAIQGANVRLAILAIGTAEGAPVRQADGALLTDRNGKVVLARLNLETLQTLTDRVNGRLATLQADDSDWQQLLSQDLLSADNSLTAESRRVDGKLSLREDAGGWLVLPLLLLVLLAFRRGSLLPVVLLVGSGFSTPSDANVWQDLWQTADQQAAQQLQRGDASAAAERFRDPDWRATAQYRAGAFEQAAQSFAENSATGLFNRGNALAHAGKLDDAIAAYDRALQLQPEFKAAQDNRAAVEAYRKRQQQSSPQQSSPQQQRDQQQEQQGAAGDDDAHAGQKSQQQQQDQKQEPSSSAQSGQQRGDQASNAEPSDRQSETEKKTGQNDPNRAQQDPGDRQQQAANASQAGKQAAEQTDEQNLPADQRPLPAALKQLPDDPGGLLRRKMKLEYLRRGQESQQVDQEQRW